MTFIEWLYRFPRLDSAKQGSSILPGLIAYAILIIAPIATAIFLALR